MKTFEGGEREKGSKPGERAKELGESLMDWSNLKYERLLMEDRK